MKLYYSPGACSLSPHIVLLEAGLAADHVKVDLASHKTADGADYYTVNGKGYVPTLQLDDGTLLTEGPAIVQYLADQAPASGLAPANGTLARYQLQEWLNFISAEIHKTLGALFDRTLSEDARAAVVARIGKRFDWLAKRLEGKQYLTGNTFSVADAYLFTLLNWKDWLKIDLTKWPVLVAYHARVAARPNVQAALKAEGLVK
jgi:glutathione S-transferase